MVGRSAFATALLRSVAWEWEHLIHSTDAQGNHKAQCKYCSTLLSAPLKYGNSHLRGHYSTCKERDALSFVKPIKLIAALVAETCTGIVVKFTPTDADQIDEQQKRCAAYSQKALPFAVTTFFAYVGAHSASSTHVTFKIAMVAFFLAVPTDLISVTRPPKWGIISFNKNYSYAILPVPIPLVIALLQLNLCPGAWQRISWPVEVEAGHDVNTEGIALRPLNTDIEAGGQDVNTQDEAVSAANTNNEADEYLDSIFNLSAGVVNFGGLVSMISRHYMGGLDKLVGFFFFFTIVLGLYLMTVTTVRTVPLTLHARNLSYPLEFLLVSTLITTLIYKVPDSGSDSHV
ncbi:unnamed protein product [Urochloa decumbens]|uniref:BED-type domain-containing protein n=1 Tax=Urochloa decumbens TaxID=240449 RepID=A0ABC9BV16_9POAL